MTGFSTGASEEGLALVFRSPRYLSDPAKASGATVVLAGRKENWDLNMGVAQNLRARVT